MDDDDTLVGELRRIAANLTAVTAEDCREIGLDDPAEQIAYSDQEAAFFASCADEIERLRADLAAERALADRLGRRLLGPCYGENDVASDWQPAIAEHCPTCLNYPSGTCPPIPAKGRPGIWRWEP